MTGITSHRHRRLPKSSYLRDGARIIDFVLTYEENSGNVEERSAFRASFQEECEVRGLVLETVKGQDGKTTFVKIHATWEALARQAELENLQMPIMKSDLGIWRPMTHRLIDAFSGGNNPCRMQAEFQPDESEFFTDAFDRERRETFLLEDEATFFSPNQRIYLTWSILVNIQIVLGRRKAGVISRLRLRRQKQTPEQIMEEDQPGLLQNANIEILLNNGTYTGVFPLHDGDARDEDGRDEYDGKVEVPDWPLRKYLFESWARPRQWTKYQPLELIRDYYGEKVGLYFAWLGFYTKMLFIPSIIGVVLFIIGIVRAFGDSPMADEICDETSNGANITICRACPMVTCDFHKLHEACLMMRVNRIFDNGTGAVFAIFMALWAVTFSELWQRALADACARWDVTEAEFSEDTVRPEYELAVSTTRTNPITKEVEVYLPTASRMQRICASLTTAFFFIALVIALVGTVMIYKVASTIFWKDLFSGTILDTKMIPPKIISSATAACMNGLFIAIMNKIYEKVAWHLTVAELPRTAGEFEESFVYKVAGFQFVNFYGAIFYLSFIRGQFMPTPDHQSQFRDRCDPSGCLLDVTIMLFVVMTGKQVVNNFIELGVPFLMTHFRRFRGGYRDLEEEAAKDLPRWEKDALLQPIEAVPLFSDYLEMTIQYGFITMFVGAFPLAPLFALINNALEIRVDAYKYLTQCQRFIPVRANNIGPWANILQLVTKIAILTNAAMVAFTTDFVEKLVYDFAKEEGQSFVQFRMSRFETADYCEADGVLTHLGGNCSEIRGEADHCWFRDYRARSNEGEYVRTKNWYLVMAAKLAFILIFEHICILVQNLIQYLIPDVPDHVRLKAKRETFLQKQIFMRHELEQKRRQRDAEEEAMVKSNTSLDKTPEKRKEKEKPKPKETPKQK